MNKLPHLDLAKEVEADINNAGWDRISRSPRSDILNGGVWLDEQRAMSIHVEFCSLSAAPTQFRLSEFARVRGIGASVAMVLVSLDGKAWQDWMHPEAVAPYITGLVAAASRAVAA